MKSMCAGRAKPGSAGAANWQRLEQECTGWAGDPACATMVLQRKIQVVEWGVLGADVSGRMVVAAVPQELTVDCRPVGAQETWQT